MVSKCGEVKVWHWAHYRKRTCDHWWENETEWHRKWKSRFPEDWQEIVHTSESGEKHIADVKTEQGWVIEFQHSFLKPEERHARNNFYQRIIWIVDGKRRKRDRLQFIRALNEGGAINEKPPVLKMPANECTLLQEWSDCHVPVLFDFGEDTYFNQSVLWCLLPCSSKEVAYITLIQREGFIALHNSKEADRVSDFADCLQLSNQIVSEYNSLIARVAAQNRSFELRKYAQQINRRRYRRHSRFRRRL